MGNDSNHSQLLEERLAQLDRAREALEERESFIARILEAVPGGVLHIGPEGSVRRANGPAQRFLGLTWSELSGRFVVDFAGRTWWEDGSDCPPEAYPVSRCLRTGLPQGPDTLGVEQPGGEIRWGVFTAIPLPEGERNGAVVTFLDITERKQTEEERERIQAQLQLADRLASLGTLAAGVAHEINNPLTYVIGNLERLALTADPHAGRLVAQALEGAGRVREIVTNLNGFSRARSDDPSTFDVRRALDAAIAMAQVEWRHRARLARGYDTSVIAQGSEGAAVQVFLNVILNAAQAIPPGQVDQHTICVGCSRADPWVVVEVADTGVGMDAETIQRAFDPFFTTKPVGEGTGLGLSISNGLVNAMGGRLEIESPASGGTTVRVWLCAETSASRPVPSVRVEPTSGGGRILIVDDEPEIREVLDWFLVGYEVSHASNGREALEQCASAWFDVVLCDLMMPEITGMELYQRVAERAPDLAARFVFMTGGAFTEAGRTFLENVPNPVITKPFDRVRVLGVVEAVREGRAAE